MNLKKIIFNTDNYYPTGEKLGNGSFGEVYLVQIKDGDTKYAAKTIINQKELSYQDQINFLQESFILQKLNHPSIVKFYGINLHSFHDPTLLQPTILTEYIEHCALKNIIDNEKRHSIDSKWNATKKFICLIGISNAFRYLHKEGVIHRDLKPANILIDSNYYPIVCDFGISKCFSEAFTNSITLENSGMFGTPLYMAPEVIKEDYYGPCVDVYSFGMLAYEITTGIEPFSKNGVSISIGNLFKEISKGNRPEFPPNFPSRMANLITKCWSQEIKDRPSFDDIFNELTSAISSKYFNETIDTDEINKYLRFIEEKIEQTKLTCKKTVNEKFLQTENENKNLKEKNEFLIKKNIALEEKNLILEDTKIALVEDITKYTKEISDFKAKNELLIKENRSLKKEISILKNENIANRHRNESLEKELASLKKEKRKEIKEFTINENKKIRNFSKNTTKPQKIEKCNDLKEVKPTIKKPHSKAKVLNQDQNYEKQKDEIDSIETHHPVSSNIIRNDNKVQNISHNSDKSHNNMMSPNNRTRKRKIKRNKSEAHENYHHNDKISSKIEHEPTNPNKAVNKKQLSKRSSSVTREIHNKPLDPNDPSIIDRKGYHYLIGKDVEQDYTKAFEYFQKAAEKNFPDAFFQLGYLYEKGLGVEQNTLNAIKYYTKAADYNIPQAFYQLGKIFVDSDFSQAIKYYNIAAKMGVPAAFYRLGWLYETGEGVERDYLKAVKLFQKAANLNYPISFYHLGYMLENGNGVDKDYNLALVYYQKAAELGQKDAIIKIDELKKKLVHS